MTKKLMTLAFVVSLVTGQLESCLGALTDAVSGAADRRDVRSRPKPYFASA